MSSGGTDQGRFGADPIEELLPRLRERARRLIGPGLRPAVGPSTLAQEALLAFVRRRAELVDCSPRQLLGWLSKAMRLRLLRFVRDTGRGVEGRAVRLGPVDPPGEVVEPLGELVRRDARRQARAALDRLDDRTRRVVLLRLEEGLPWRDVADRLQITETHARVLHHRALGRLRDLLGGSAS